MRTGSGLPGIFTTKGGYTPREGQRTVGGASPPEQLASVFFFVFHAVAVSIDDDHVSDFLREFPRKPNNRFPDAIRCKKVMVITLGKIGGP